MADIGYKMPCQYQQIIKSPKDGKAITVECGKCILCRKKRAGDWSFRLLQETKNYPLAVFATFTYNPENVPEKNGTYLLQKSDLQKAFKRLRKSINHRKIIYYAVGEYGDKFNRPHYHAIIFNATPDEIKKCWSSGFVKIDKVNEKTINYVTGYITKENIYRGEKAYRPFSVMSKGIGLRYVEKNAEYHRQKLTPLTVYKGVKQIIPRYLREKIFDDEMKEIISEQMRDYQQQHKRTWKQLEVLAKNTVNNRKIKKHVTI